MLSQACLSVAALSKPPIVFACEKQRTLQGRATRADLKAVSTRFPDADEESKGEFCNMTARPGFELDDATGSGDWQTDDVTLSIVCDGEVVAFVESVEDLAPFLPGNE